MLDLNGKVGVPMYDMTYLNLEEGGSKKFQSDPSLTFILE